MKFLKFLVIIFIVLGGLSYGAYHFGTNYASEKIADTVSAEIENTENIEGMKQAINNHPEIKELIEEGANIAEEDLPFTTVEEASKTIVKKVGLIELQKMHSKYQNGVSQNEIQEIVKEIEGKLTEEEILALKALAYKELNK